MPNRFFWSVSSTGLCIRIAVIAAVLLVMHAG